jgi:pimeloyl-ACP methyl ester carboxylesterase
MPLSLSNGLNTVCVDGLSFRFILAKSIINGPTIPKIWIQRCALICVTRYGSQMIPTARNALQGELFLYAQGRAAFESPTSLPNKCILLGGLSDGLWPVPYTAQLESAIGAIGWSLVQPILSSSYTGFGHGSLDRDVAELDELIDHLVDVRGATRLAMVGHSTGAQDIVHFIRHGRQADKVVAAALQAPVSDREAATICHDADMDEQDHQHQLNENLAVATRMRDDGRLDELMPRAAFWAPITASRYLDLTVRGGRDDYFSSDYTDAELHERLSHLQTTRCLFACSGADEYIPKTVDIPLLMERLCRAAAGAMAESSPQPGLYLPTGNHNLSSRDGADALSFVAAFVDVLKDIV